MRWGMVIDVARCVGCQACTVACKQEHGLPAETAWRWVADCEVGEYPDVRRLFLPMQCMHCAAPPCVPVCPTGASRQRQDGIVWIDAAACVGCGYCSMACPYQARHPAPSPTGHVDAVMTKCTFCKERVDGGLERGLVPGVDPDATPACAGACIAGAIVFGDLDDEASAVSRLSRSDRAQVLLPEAGTAPRVYYLGD